MSLLAAKTNLLRSRNNSHGNAPVTPIELFFDLVFVFAVIQLSTELRLHLTPIGLLHTLIEFAAVWWVWVYTSWITNWLDPKHQPVRIMLVALSFLALLLACAVPNAFNGRGIAFAGAYVAMQLGRSLFMLWSVRRFDPVNVRNMARISIWLAISGLFWLGGGLATEPARTQLWLIALAFDFAAPALGFYVPGLGRSRTTDWNIDSYHLAERFAAFILIALGETILVTGETFYELHWTLADASRLPRGLLSDRRTHGGSISTKPPSIRRRLSRTRTIPDGSRTRPIPMRTGCWWPASSPRRRRTPLCCTSRIPMRASPSN